MSMGHSKGIPHSAWQSQFSNSFGGVLGLMGAVIERIQRSALMLMLTVASVNALVLAVAAISQHAARAPVRTVLAAAVAATIAVVPRARGQRFALDLKKVRWLPSAGAALGAGVLCLAPESRSILFAALLTPVGVAVLADDRREALNATALVTIGYLVAATEPAARSTLGVAIGDLSPAFAVILGGLVPAALAARAIKARARLAAEWRRNPSAIPAGRRPGRPGIGIEHDQAILAGVRAGVSDGMIAIERGLQPWQVRDRIKVLARERGVEGRRGLTRLLNEQALPEAAGGR
jgi:hypothetical protein